jgi:hypothetical protein
VERKGDNGVRERDSGEEWWSEKLCVREGVGGGGRGGDGEIKKEREGCME